MARVLFTIGHSTHSLEHFLRLLQRHSIEVVADVRSIPYSQHNPQFNREALQIAVKAQGMSYVFLGKELGARSDNPGCYIDGKVQYNYLAEEPIFLAGLSRLKRGVQQYRVALMCAEKDPLTCHRTILVCREMKSPELEILHILGDGEIETHVAAEHRLMTIMGIMPDMLQSTDECIEEAYEKQANRIAFTRVPEDQRTRA